MVLTAQRLRELFEYDPTTGCFKRRYSRGSQKSGAVAGANDPDGYLRIRIDYAELGADRHKGRWRSSIGVGGKKKHLGYFDTAEEAHAAHVQAKIKLHPFWAAPQSAQI
jgi:hypothetical protein